MLLTVKAFDAIVMERGGDERFQPEIAVIRDRLAAIWELEASGRGTGVVEARELHACCLRFIVLNGGRSSSSLPEMVGVKRLQESIETFMASCLPRRGEMPYSPKMLHERIRSVPDVRTVQVYHMPSDFRSKGDAISPGFGFGERMIVQWVRSCFSGTNFWDRFFRFETKTDFQMPPDSSGTGLDVLERMLRLEGYRGKRSCDLLDDIPPLSEMIGCDFSVLVVGSRRHPALLQAWFLREAIRGEELRVFDPALGELRIGSCEGVSGFWSSRLKGMGRLDGIFFQGPRVHAIGEVAAKKKVAAKKIACPQCRSLKVIKHGFQRGRQRYRCKSAKCGLNFQLEDLKTSRFKWIEMASCPDCGIPSKSRCGRSYGKVQFRCKNKVCPRKCFTYGVKGNPPHTHVKEICPRCKGTHTRKAGFASGKQRWMCMEEGCHRKTFYGGSIR